MVPVSRCLRWGRQLDATDGLLQSVLDDFRRPFVAHEPPEHRMIGHPRQGERLAEAVREQQQLFGSPVVQMQVLFDEQARQQLGLGEDARRELTGPGRQHLLGDGQGRLCEDQEPVGFLCRFPWCHRRCSSQQSSTHHQELFDRARRSKRLPKQL
jgi:hypothetical protein